MVKFSIADIKITVSGKRLISVMYSKLYCFIHSYVPQTLLF